MKITYDADVDALDIRFRETTVTTKHISGGLAAEYDSEGHLAGLEIPVAAERLGGAEAVDRVTLDIWQSTSTP